MRLALGFGALGAAMLGGSASFQPSQELFAVVFYGCAAMLAFHALTYKGPGA